MIRIHWHRYNPWKDSVVYVPIKRLAECVADGMISDHTGKAVPHDVDYVLSRWRRASNKLDAYILPQPTGYEHSIGVRYGWDGSQYFSPYNAHPEMTKALLAKFRGQPFKVVNYPVRRRECMSCKYRWTQPVEFSVWTQNLSGEATVQCPYCNSKAVISYPTETKEEAPT